MGGTHFFAQFRFGVMTHFLSRAGIFLLLLMVCAVRPARAEEARDAAAAIAQAAGYDRFGSVGALEFNFNADIGDKKIRRSWKWWPREDKVRYTAPDGEVTEYLRGGPEVPREIDGWFINDQYWLLFPLHLQWDTTARLESFEPAPADREVAGKAVQGLRVIYPGDSGYTPGDIYELFYDDAHRIVRWHYRKGGREKPNLTAGWEDYRSFGPLTLSLEHPGASKDFRLWFTGVRVEP